MCLAVPAKVVLIDDTDAIVEIGGVTSPISLTLMEEVQVGDYVLVHAGFAIEKVDPKEAEETLRLIREIIGSDLFYLTGE
mgnify:FL=1